MTMAFAVIAFSAVNLGLVMRREREPAWAPAGVPYLGHIRFGGFLTWAAVELGMLQRLLDTTSLSGGQWLTVLALSLIAPAIVAVDKFVQLIRQRRRGPAPAPSTTRRRGKAGIGGREARAVERGRTPPARRDVHRVPVEPDPERQRVGPEPRDG
jgi:hypothetical protein